MRIIQNRAQSAVGKKGDKMRVQTITSTRCIKLHLVQLIKRHLGKDGRAVYAKGQVHTKCSKTRSG